MALLFLIIIAALGAAVGNVSVLEEHMAGATRDRDLALQAAEAALHDAQERLRVAAFRASAFPAYNAASANTKAYWETCFGPPAVAPCDSAYAITTSLPITGSGAVASQPQFVVERKPNGPGVPPVENFRVTAYAVGGSSAASVILQSEVRIQP